LAKRVCGLVSGGKDSNYAFYRAIREVGEPACIMAVEPARRDSYMFHYPHVGLVRLQAEAMGLSDRLVYVRVSGRREVEVEELARALEGAWDSYGFDVLSVGALASRYQESRIRRIAARLGVEVYAPAWQADPEEYMRRLVGEGFRFIIVRIATMGLSPGLLGRVISPGEVEEVIGLARRYGFHPAFEGGEAETLVVDAPHYRALLVVEGEPVKLGPYEWELAVKTARLEPKLVE